MNELFDRVIRGGDKRSTALASLEQIGGESIRFSGGRRSSAPSAADIQNMMQSNSARGDAYAKSRAVGLYGAPSPEDFYGPKDGDVNLSNNLRGEVYSPSSTVQSRRERYALGMRIGERIRDREDRQAHEHSMLKAEQVMNGQPHPLRDAAGNTLGYAVDTGNGNRAILPPVTAQQAMGEGPVVAGEFYNDGKGRWIERRGSQGADDVGPILRQAWAAKEAGLKNELDEHQAKIAEGDYRFGLFKSRKNRVKEIMEELEGIAGGRGKATEQGQRQGQQQMPAALEQAITAAKEAGQDTFVYQGKEYRVP